ncbi:MAG: response regulator transcription factor [Pseudomonadales bacterium]|nr:response regulator transcription factor [Pseudomonadales bacterium]
MINILIADDHAIVRQGLSRVISLAEDIKVRAEAADGWELLERLRKGGIDLVLTDMSMPGPSGVELIKRIRARSARLPVLILSMHSESQIAARAIKAGASGYLTKDSDPAMLLAAIRECAGGGHYIEPRIASLLVFNNGASAGGEEHKLLTEREFQIFLLLAKGRGVNEIAGELGISAKTVSTHKFRLMQKMNLDSLSELVRYAIRQGLIES